MWRHGVVSLSKKFSGKEQSMASKRMLKVTLVRSPIRQLPNHKLCVQGLGLKRMHQTVEVEDTPSVRGMINKVYYMVRVEGEA